MKLRTLFLLLVLVAIFGFAALNWTVFLAPTALNLIVADVQAPLGLIMLCLIGFLTVLFLVYALYLQTTVMYDARTHAKELQTNRKLADEAEASRFTELRNFLDVELKMMVQTHRSDQLTLLARLDKLNHDVSLAVEQSGNSVAAAVAEMDDRLNGRVLNL